MPPRLDRHQEDLSGVDGESRRAVTNMEVERRKSRRVPGSTVPLGIDFLSGPRGVAPPFEPEVLDRSMSCSCLSKTVR